MKKGIIWLMIVGSLLIILGACSGKKEDKEAGVSGKSGQEGNSSEVVSESKGPGGVFGDDPEEEAWKARTPDISQIRSICELATLKCYYHNVAKSVKEKGKGLSHIGEKERIFWIEYSGVARFGINVSGVKMETKGNEILITIPKAELLGLSDHTFAEGSYISSDDGFNKNPITSENQTEAVAAAEEDIREMFAKDDTILSKAQDNAKKLIENYIQQLGQLSEVEYKITWKYEENLPEE